MTMNYERDDNEWGKRMILMMQEIPMNDARDTNEIPMNDAREDNEWWKRWQWMVHEMAMNDARDDKEVCRRWQWMM